MATKIEGLLEDFQSRLDRGFNDWSLRLVFADFLEDELGDPVAAQGQRWQARYKKRPHAAESSGTWDWWGPGDPRIHHPSDLPRDVYDLLGGPYRECSVVCKEFPSRRAAEASLALALAKKEEPCSNSRS